MPRRLPERARPKRLNAVDEQSDRKKEKKTGFWLLLTGLFLVGMPLFNGLFHKSLEGYLLVATEGFAQPFDHAVIYILHHNIYGAHGVVLNKKAQEGGVADFIGGPVPAGIQFYDMTGERRSYVGYAGWGPMQLDMELKRELTWHVLHPDDQLLSIDTDAMWNAAMERIEKQKETPADLPKQSRPATGLERG